MIAEETARLTDATSDSDTNRQVPTHVNSADDAGFTAILRHLLNDAWAIRYFFMLDFAGENGRLPWSPIAAIGRPAGLMLVFAGFFSLIGAPPIEGKLPFPLFVLSGMVTWQFLERVYWSTSHAFAARRYLMANMAFSRLAIPVAVVASALLELVGSFVFLALLSMLYGVSISASIWALPFVIGLLAFGGVGLGVGVATAGARIRAMHQIGPIFIRFWFFGTPIFYRAEDFLGGYVWIYNLVNPAASFIELVRWSMYSLGQPSLLVASGTVVYVVLFTLGCVRYFQTQQGRLGDVV